MQANKIYRRDALEGLSELPEESIDHILTDPPYGSERRDRGTRNKSRQEWTMALDFCGVDTTLRFMRQIAMGALRVCRPGGHAYVFSDWRNFTHTVTTWESAGWVLRNVLVWDKNKGGALGSFWRNNHEWVCIFSKGTPKRLPDGTFYNTYTCSKPHGGLHPTEKPLALLKYILRGLTGLILDPFAGSGSTLVACRELGLPFIGFELHEPYVDLARRRLQAAGGEP